MDLDTFITVRKIKTRTSSRGRSVGRYYYTVTIPSLCVLLLLLFADDTLFYM